MTEMDFLKYNYSELLNLANHGTLDQNVGSKTISKHAQTVPRRADSSGLLLARLIKSVNPNC
jgi:hypothetical protein